MSGSIKSEGKMEKEEFRKLAVDMKPVIKDMEDVLRKHEVKCIASLTICADGYFNFSTHNSSWEFKRTDSSGKSLICTYTSEEV